MNKSPYQNNYSELYSHELNDQTRKAKALKTLAVLEDCLAEQISGSYVLEVGCFTGEIGLSIAAHFASYTAIDIDRNAIDIARKKNVIAKQNIQFETMNAEMLSFKDNSFDVVICSHVYEHVPHPERMMKEIHRVLKNGGVCYFAASNRFIIMEPHYRLPFLTYFPKSLANVYLNAAKGRSPYYETHLSLFSLRKLVSKFAVTDYTIKIIKEPDKFHASDMVQQGSIKQKVGLIFVTLFYWLSPTYIWILRK